MVTCTHCKVEVKQFRKETAGYLLILFVPIIIYLFGISIVGLIWDILMLSVGLYWIVTKPSKSFVCKDCISKLNSPT